MFRSIFVEAAEMTLEFGDEPCGRRSRVAVIAVHGIKRPAGLTERFEPEFHQPAVCQILGDHPGRQVAPADARAHYKVLGMHVGEPPGAMGEDAKVPPLRAPRRIGDDELDMIAQFLLCHRAPDACQRVARRGDGDHRHIADLDESDIGIRYAADANIGLALHHLIDDESQGADIEAHRHRRKLSLEGLKNANQHRCRQRRIDRERDLAFQSLTMALDARADALQHVRHAPRFLEHPSPHLRQFGFARPFPLEQFDIKLRFEIGDRVADDRLRSVQLAAGRREASCFGDRQEDLELVEGRIRLHKYQFHRCKTSKLYQFFLCMGNHIFTASVNPTRKSPCPSFSSLRAHAGPVPIRPRSRPSSPIDSRRLIPKPPWSSGISPPGPCPISISTIRPASTRHRKNAASGRPQWSASRTKQWMSLSPPIRSSSPPASSISTSPRHSNPGSTMSPARAGPSPMARKAPRGWSPARKSTSCSLPAASIRKARPC